jgi:hypothetical protein
MRNGMKLVCVTPAGRRRYMRLLVPYVLSLSDLDRYDIWVNTPDAADLAFLEEVARIDGRIRLVALPGDPGPAKIRQFWPHAMDTDTVYLRLDDDVVWLDPGFFETLLACRFVRSEDFMIAPLVINNALSSFLLQTFGKISTTEKLGPDRFDPYGWVSPTLAVSLHGLFQELIAAGDIARLAFGRVPISGNCFSINALCWFGRDIAAIEGFIPDGEDEEAAVGCTIPLRAGRINCIETSAVAAHFAFYTQRLAMDASGLLEGYGRIASKRPELAPWREKVEAIYEDFETRFPHHQSLGGFAPYEPPPDVEVVSAERGPAF